MSEPDAASVARVVDAFVAARSPGVAIAGDTQLFALGLLDSVALVELAAALEDGFDITVADAELVPANFASRDQIVRYVVGKRAG